MEVSNNIKVTEKRENKVKNDTLVLEILYIRISKEAEFA